MGNLGSSPSQSTRHKSLQTNVIRTRDDDVHKKYEVTKVLGEGSIGAVSRVRMKESAVGGSAYNAKEKGCFGTCLGKKKSAVIDRSVKVDYAMKSIIMRRISDAFMEELRNEIEILRNLDHPNIVKAYEVFDTTKQIYMIMELCSGGDLYTRKPYTEKESAKIIGKLLSALKHMHDNGIMHRDLKFENIMFENRSADAEIKLIDFGLSSKFSAAQPYLYDGVGTIYTMAPQVLQGVYTTQADLWSVGVITYILLAGQKPFYSRKRRRLLDKIMRCDYEFDSRIWKTISPEAQNFVSSLIEMDPRKRLSAKKSLEHTWQNKTFPLSDRRPSEAVMQNVENNLMTFGNMSELRKLALVLVAHNSSTEEILHLRKAFDQYDKANDGRISYEEFQEVTKENNPNISQEEMDKIFSALDINQNGSIMYTEFIAACLDAQGLVEEERIAAAFDRIDSDDTGFISKANLMDLIGNSLSPARAEDLIKEVDSDNDGQISFDEFLRHCRKNNLERKNEVASLDKTQSERDTERGSEELVGIHDVKIPGGEFDQSNRLRA